MKRMSTVPLVAVLVAAGAGPLLASDPVGVYALIDRVVLEPADGAPQRIQIRGVFALADGEPGGRYQPARRGYLYYALAAGKEEICRKEWADLRAIAGTGQAIGFGGRYRANGRLRRESEEVAAPDPYPVRMGLVKLGEGQWARSIETELKAVPPER